VALTVARCLPEVVCAYPISPQTHIVEALAELVRSGELTPCEYLNVESEFAAMSVAIGASATGARAYTATAARACCSWPRRSTTRPGWAYRSS
jgi:pyruvate ferredoxin oxidoreductase alpha subunit